jgi:DNA-3-methyladenine glycosylase II
MENHSGPAAESREGMSSPRPQALVAALAYLRQADPVLARVIDENPAFDPGAWSRRWPALDLFGALVLEVIGQQISVIAASAIFRRLLERFGGAAPDPGKLATADPEVLHELGLSRRKAGTEVKGVGPWTAKGALLIAHRRPDLVRTDDVALRRVIQVQYGLDQLPTPDAVADLARSWSPYRSLASSLLLATTANR